MTRLGWHSTTTDVIKSCNASLTGKTVLITGGSSGLGTETARALARIGARVIFTGRSAEAGTKVAQELQEETSNHQVVFKQLDLASLRSITTFTDDILQTEKHLDILICNAGVMACPQSYTADGFEMQIGTNHFGHFALVQPLLKLLESQGSPSRIVVLSSLAHKAGVIDLDDLHFNKRRYTKFSAYGQSKLANALYARELAKRTGSSVSVFSLHPGSIFTNLGRHVFTPGSFAERWARWVASFVLKNVPQGAATTVYAAVWPGLEQHSGAYLSDCAVVKPSKAAQDMDMAARLWEVTEQQLAEKQRAVVDL